jgi:tetratricopeptide (TPR) repeat protein
VATFTALRALGDAQCEAGDAHAAIATLEPALENRESVPTQLTSVWGFCSLGEAYLLAGDLHRAEASAYSALELNAGLNPVSNALASRLLGRVAFAKGERDASNRHLTCALQAFQECGASFEAGRVHLDLARLLASRDDRNTIQVHIAAAIRAFDASGAPRRTASALALAQALEVDSR